MDRRGPLVSRCRGAYTRKGSFGSDVSVILNWTLAAAGLAAMWRCAVWGVKSSEQKLYGYSPSDMSVHPLLHENAAAAHG